MALFKIIIEIYFINNIRCQPKYQFTKFQVYFICKKANIVKAAALVFLKSWCFEFLSNFHENFKELQKYLLSNITHST